MARQQQELLGQPESAGHRLALKKQHAWARVLWQAAGQGLGMPACTPGQSHSRSGGAWPGAVGGDFYKQRVFPGVSNHLVLAADRGRTIVPHKKEETSREQVLCCCVPILTPLPGQPQAEQPGGLAQSSDPMLGCAASPGDEPLSLPGWPTDKSRTGVQLGQGGCRGEHRQAGNGSFLPWGCHQRCHAGSEP